MKRALPFAVLAAAGIMAVSAHTPEERNEQADVAALVAAVLESMPETDSLTRYSSLTDEDFEVVAKQLDVETAAIKAVVRIEAGSAMQGFWAPGVPVANYSKTLFNRYSKKVKGRKVKDGKVPAGLKGYALREWTALVNARKINADAADMGTYWGMFQIGGFNYKLCECSSVQEMVELVSDSEFSQLEMFAIFIRNAGMLDALRKKDWRAFARKYNGPSYAKRGYHTRMAKEYEKFSKKSKTIEK